MTVEQLIVRGLSLTQAQTILAMPEADREAAIVSTLASGSGLNDGEVEIVFPTGFTLDNVEAFDSMPKLPLSVSFERAKFWIVRSVPAKFPVKNTAGGTTDMFLVLIKVESYPKAFGMSLNALKGTAKALEIPLLINGKINPNLYLEKIEGDKYPQAVS